MLRKKLGHSLFVESYGVVLRLSSNSEEALVRAIPMLKSDLPGCLITTEREDWDHDFAYIWNPGKLDGVYKDREKIAVRRKREHAFQLLASQMRLAVAEFAPEHVFIHAGVVALNGKAVVIPARSFRGKTTLTAALVRKGALYYSDEYAVVDKTGKIHPFPKDLSIRGIINDRAQVDIAVEKLGGRKGTKPIPAGLILITEYKENARWRPKRLTQGQGIMEMISHTVPIRQNTEFAMRVLGNLVQSAEVYKSNRGDAEKTVGAILKLVEERKTAA